LVLFELFGDAGTAGRTPGRRRLAAQSNCGDIRHSPATVTTDCVVAVCRRDTDESHLGAARFQSFSQCHRTKKQSQEPVQHRKGDEWKPETAVLVKRVRTKALVMAGEPPTAWPTSTAGLERPALGTPRATNRRPPATPTTRPSAADAICPVMSPTSARAPICWPPVAIREL